MFLATRNYLPVMSKVTSHNIVDPTLNPSLTSFSTILIYPVFTVFIFKYPGRSSNQLQLGVMDDLDTVTLWPLYGMGQRPWWQE